MSSLENFLECRCFPRLSKGKNRICRRKRNETKLTSLPRNQCRQVPGILKVGRLLIIFTADDNTHTEEKNAAGDNNVTFADERNYFLTWKNRIKVAVKEQNGDCEGRLW